MLIAVGQRQTCRVDDHTCRVVVGDVAFNVRRGGRCATGDGSGEPITFRRVATVARVSTGWLYAQPEVKERISRLRGQPAETAGRTAKRASDASKDAIVRALRQHVGALEDERRRPVAHIQQLEERIEVLYGELYAKRGELPHAIADPTSSPSAS